MRHSFNLSHIFDDLAEQYSDKTALLFSEREYYTYGELKNRSEILCRFLIQNNLKKGDIIAIAGHKSLDTFALIIASLKLGIIYSIIDSDSPSERLSKIFDRCKPNLIIADYKLYNILSVEQLSSYKNIAVSYKELTKFNSNSTDIVDTTGSNITGTNPAYIMFTSGSTGFPKGAVMTHDNVKGLIDWAKSEFNIEPEDIHTNVNPLYFDNSVFDFYTTIFNGATLVPFNKEIVSDPVNLISEIDKLKCSSWFSVPSMLVYLQTLKLLSQNNMKYIKRFIFGGEGYPKSKLKELFEIYGDRASLFNVYGPTECTCMCSSYVVTEIDFKDLNGFPPLGKIANNFDYLILDDNNNQVEEGEAGELCLLGPLVGKGYYNDSNITEENFIQNPINSKFNDIIYKTGDLVSFNPKDKKIYIHGRIDNQVKHMGYRIELEEIETALNRLSGVKECIVFQDRNNNISHLKAVIVSEDENKNTKLKDRLKEIIPNYMVPTKFYFENKLPKNANGKIDRKTIIQQYKKER